MLVVQQSAIQSAPAGQKMPHPMKYFLTRRVRDTLLGFHPMSLVVHLPENSEEDELGEVGVLRSAFVKRGK